MPWVLAARSHGTTSCSPGLNRIASQPACLARNRYGVGSPLCWTVRSLIASCLPDSVDHRLIACFTASSLPGSTIVKLQIRSALRVPEAKLSTVVINVNGPTFTGAILGCWKHFGLAAIPMIELRLVCL